MTKDDKAFLIGCVIGDGCINRRMIRDKDYYRIMIKHSEKQYDYVKWKAEEIERILATKSKAFKPRTKLLTKCPNSGRSKITAWRYERGHKYFSNLYHFLYPSNTKTLSRKVLNRLTAQAIAIWYMDDGSLYNPKRNGKYRVPRITLNTYISEEDNKIIQTYFKEVWDIEFRINKDKSDGIHKGHTRLVICKLIDASRFIELVKPYIHPSMMYKVNVKYGQTVESAEPLVTKGEDIVHEIG